MAPSLKHYVIFAQRAPRWNVRCGGELLEDMIFTSLITPDYPGSNEFTIR